MAIQNYTPSQEKTKETINAGTDILLLGKPGTGKTELIKDVCEEQASNGKKVLVTASTGLAASNLDGGRTIHSALRWNPNSEDFKLERCSEALEKADLLVIDEVSMLGMSIINHLVNCLNYVDHKPQLILSGDFFQLPPITPKGYTRQYPFENRNWNRLGLIPCFLEEIVRQRDPEFKVMLEKAMLGDVSCIPYFNERTQKKLIEGAITLCTRNNFADEINAKKMALLPGLPKSYYAVGNLNAVDFDKTRVEECFSVKKHMRVMSLRNDSSGKYQNGSLGTVMDMDEDIITVRFDNGEVAEIKRIPYLVEAKKDASKEIRIEQFPLRGGYAISIHKSQGQTFDAVNIKAPSCWDPGQLYVALSRARTIDGIHLMEPIVAKSLLADSKVINYYRSLHEDFAA